MGLLGLTPVNAFVAEHLQSGQLESEHAPQMAILLDEKGVPRCKVEGEHSEFLSVDRFGEFVENDPGANAILDEINALRECDDGDVAYAGIVLAPEEIQAAAITGFHRGVISAMAMATYSFVSCMSGGLFAKDRQPFLLSLNRTVHRSAFWSIVHSFIMPPILENAGSLGRTLFIISPGILLAYAGLGVGFSSFCYIVMRTGK